MVRVKPQVMPPIRGWRKWFSISAKKRHVRGGDLVPFRPLAAAHKFALLRRLHLCVPTVEHRWLCSPSEGKGAPRMGNEDDVPGD
jgi:hypothetical protein